MRQGGKREVRRMLKAAGYRTQRLCRVAVGGVSLGDLRSGDVAELRREDLLGLYADACERVADEALRAMPTFDDESGEWIPAYELAAREFESFRAVPLADLEELLRRVVVVDIVSKNTVEEVEVGLKSFAEARCHKAMLVSSPTHLPRCLACACRVEAEQPELFDGSVWASPSDTSYHNFSPSDVVVVEPPHRGDRDTSLDRLPFHEMVKRSYRIQAERKEAFLEELEQMLCRFGV